jgi:hypothetical protein
VGRALTAAAIVGFAALASLFGLSLTRSSDVRPVPAIEVAHLERASQPPAKRPKRAKPKSTGKKAPMRSRVADPTSSTSRADPARNAPKVARATAGKSRNDERAPSGRSRGAPVVSVPPVPVTPVPVATDDPEPTIDDEMGNDDPGGGAEPASPEPDLDGS